MNEYNALKLFDDYLDEQFPDLTIIGYHHKTSNVLRQLSPATYREEFMNWLHAEEIHIIQFQEHRTYTHLFRPICSCGWHKQGFCMKYLAVEYANKHLMNEEKHDI